jgi:hypothetical protein
VVDLLDGVAALAAGATRDAWGVADTAAGSAGTAGTAGARPAGRPDAKPGAGASGGTAGKPAPKPDDKSERKPPGETVALVGFAAPVSGLVEPALGADGYTVARVTLDADKVRALVRAKPRVVVLDCHPYVDARSLHADLRAAPELAETAVVAVGPPEAPEVPGLEVVRQPGRALELDRLLQAIHRAAGRYTG